MKDTWSRRCQPRTAPRSTESCGSCWDEPSSSARYTPNEPPFPIIAPFRADPESHSQMLGKIPAARLALIEKIVARASRVLPKSSHKLAAEFLRAYFRGVAEEDLRAHRPQDLAAA